MTSPKANAANKPRVCKRSLREVYAHLSTKGKPRTERGRALAEFAKAYPCHLETARKVANGRAEIPAMLAALNDWFAERKLPPCRVIAA